MPNKLDYNNTLFYFKIDGWNSAWNYGLFNPLTRIFYNIRIYGNVTKDIDTFSILVGRLNKTALVEKVECDLVITAKVNVVTFVMNLSASVKVNECFIKYAVDIAARQASGLFHSTFQANQIEVNVTNTRVSFFVGS